MTMKEQIINYLNEKFYIYLNDLSQYYEAYIGTLTQEDRVKMDNPFIIEEDADDMVLAISVQYDRRRDNPDGTTIEAKSLIHKSDLRPTLQDTLGRIEKRVIRSLILDLTRMVREARIEKVKQ